MEPDPPSEQYGRGMRKSRRSLRAKQAAGLDDEAIKQLSRPSNGTINPSMIMRPSATFEPTPQQLRKLLPTPADNMAEGKAPARGNTPMSTTDSHDFAYSSSTATLAAQNASQTTAPQPSSNASTLAGDVAAAFHTKQPALRPPVPQSQTRATPGKVIDSAQSTPIKDSTPTKPPAKVTKPQKGNKKKAAKRAAPQKQPKETPTATKDIQKPVPADSELSAARFHIYQWEHPIPTDFLNLSDEWKAAKAYVDDEEGKRDDAPELDDWDEFVGTENMLLPIPLKIGIALNFVSRAKRAYRTGRTFASFEQEELAIDSKAGANAIKDPVERKLALRDTLDNDTRLYVYEQLKVRLCHEIWLQPYPEADEEAAPPRANISFNEAGPSSQRQPLRTEPELPGQFRELHQPQGGKPRMS
jgi:hypothetical protein